MNDHWFGNIWWLVFLVLFVVQAIRRQFKRLKAPPIPFAPVPPRAPRPDQLQAEPLMRRRLVPARPIVPPVLPDTARVTIVPSMAETLPAEAAAAFPGLDLTLPDAPVTPGTAPGRRRPMRALGGGPPVGSRGWGANAIVAMEILGPPVSLRPGATLGAPHAF